MLKLAETHQQDEWRSPPLPHLLYVGEGGCRQEIYQQNNMAHYNKCYLSREQKRDIKREQSDYRRRIGKYRKHPINTLATVISTKTISEPSFKDQYHNFLRSDFWKRQRSKILRKHRHCMICKSSDDLNVHHISYKHIFHEKHNENDVVVLCRYHHDEFHRLYGVKKVMVNQWKCFIKLKREEIIAIENENEEMYNLCKNL